MSSEPPTQPRERRERRERREPTEPPRPQLSLPLILAYLAAGLVVLWIWQAAFEGIAEDEISYSEFKARLAAGEIESVYVEETVIRGRMAPPEGAEGEKDQEGEGARAFKTVRIDDPDLVRDLREAGVEFSGVRPGILTEILLAWAIPIGLMVLLWVYLSRRMGSLGAGMAGFGRSRARVAAEHDIQVDFGDVAGCEEAKAELAEVVDFLKNPSRYRSLGARIPKGVLLVGPPGTGKTLLARAVAGEAGVPFFSLSGSEFVEMFVGVGAARVRDLFEQAKAQAPCIVFIDELDAVGRQRGIHVMPGGDEREQTLNQLLVEMDGFEPNAGVILLSATNRPETLDRALLRPGRFDRQVVLDAPDVVGREAILRVHARGKPLAPEVDLAVVARTTPGFSGADLANVMNEAALLAARAGEPQVSQAHLQEAVEKVVAGPERKSRRLSDEDKRRVAYHEVGHALVAAYSEHADPVHKITIVPRGRAALGYTMQLPTGDQVLLSRSELVSRIRGLLSGRAAEELVFKEVSTGAQNDLERATALAREMVTVYGMGESTGLMHCARREAPYLTPDAVRPDCSEDTARAIDAEVKEILAEAYREARALLEAHRAALERVSRALLERETLQGDEFQRLLEETE